jgi:molecular chaperone GrpE (heat shock protein)
MADRNEIEIIVTAEVDKALKGLKKTEDGAEKLNKKTGSLNKGFSKLKAGVIGVAAILSGTLAVAFGKTIKLASDFEEANAKFGTTFRGVSKEANAMRKNLVQNYNLSTKSATELLSNTGDLLSGFGFTGKAALDLSGQVNTLAADLSSFANVPVEQASEAISKGLLGERESMKSLGIAISETDVKQRLMLNGKADLRGMALKQAKAEATLQLALEQSKNAIGDVERTQDSLANTGRRFVAAFEDIRVAIGQKLIKALKPTIDKFVEFSRSAEGLSVVDKAVKSLVSAFIVLRATADIAFTNIVTGIKNMVAGFQAATGFFTKLFSGDFKGAFEELKEGGIEIFDSYKGAAINAKDEITGAFTEIKELWAQTNAAQIEGINNIVAADTIATDTMVENSRRLTEEQKKNIGIALQAADQAASNLKGISDGLFQAQLNNVEAGSKKELEIKKKQAKADKAFGIFQTVIDTIQAVAKANKATPFPPVNAILMALAGVQGAAQTAAIASTPLPSFQQGSQFIPDDMIAQLHQGERVLTREENNDFSQSFSGGITVIANNPEDFAEQMNEYQRTHSGANA